MLAKPSPGSCSGASEGSRLCHQTLASAYSRAPVKEPSLDGASALSAKGTVCPALLLWRILLGFPLRFPFHRWPKPPFPADRGCAESTANPSPCPGPGSTPPTSKEHLYPHEGTTNPSHSPLHNQIGFLQAYSKTQEQIRLHTTPPGPFGLRGTLRGITISTTSKSPSLRGT